MTDSGDMERAGFKTRVKIVTFYLDRREEIMLAELELMERLEEGWQIVAAGGAGQGEYDGQKQGFVILTLAASAAQDGAPATTDA